MFVRQIDDEFYGLVDGSMVRAKSSAIFRQVADNNQEAFCIQYENGMVAGSGWGERQNTESSWPKFIVWLLKDKPLFSTVMAEWLELEEALPTKEPVTSGRIYTPCPLWDEVLPEEGSSAYPITKGFEKEVPFVPHVYWKSRDGFVALAKMSKSHIHATIAFLQRYEENAYDLQNEKLASRWISLFKNELKRREEGKF